MVDAEREIPTFEYRDLTKLAAEAIDRGQQESKNDGTPMTIEHLLIGIILQERSHAGYFLNEQQVDIGALITDLRHTAQMTSGHLSTGERVSELRQALDWARKEKERLSHSNLSTAHMFIALAKNPRIGDILARHGTSVNLISGALEGLFSNEDSKFVVVEGPDDEENSLRLERMAKAAALASIVQDRKENGTPAAKQALEALEEMTIVIVDPNTPEDVRSGVTEGLTSILGELKKS